MKKIILIIGLIVLTSFNVNLAYADDDDDTGSSPYVGEESDPDFGPQEDEDAAYERDFDESTLKTREELEAEREEANSLRGATFDVGDVFDLGEDEEGNPIQDTGYMNDPNPLQSFIVGVITFATQVIGSIAVILFIVAGFMFMLAQGNEQRLSDAKEVIKYAVIGLAVTFLSYVIVLFIQSLFNR